MNSFRRFLLKNKAVKIFIFSLLTINNSLLTVPRARADDFFFDSFDFDFDFDMVGSDWGMDAGLPQGTIVRNAMGAPLGEIETVNLAPGMEYVDVNDFDIGGAMLGMTFQDVQALFFRSRSLYSPRQRNSIIYTVADDWRFNLDYECRHHKSVVIPNRVEQCILTLARSRGLLYPSSLHLERRATGETIDIFFTSNATDNSVWKVVYNNDVNNLEGSQDRFVAQRERKILVFWENVLDKFGTPNSSGGDRWISSDNSFDPTMRAFYGRLELTDRGLAGRDAAVNVRDSKENFRPKPYFF